jgi:hypothetical protein
LDSIASAVVCGPSPSTVTEARKPVDEAVSNDPGRARSVNAGDRRVELDDLVGAEDGPVRRRPLAATVGVDGHVLGEQRAQLLPVARARG